jgi:hypothetical protein
MTTQKLATRTRNSATESISNTGAASRFAVLFVASARTDGGAWEDCTDEPPRVASRRVTWLTAIAAAIIINAAFVAVYAAKIAAFVAAVR